MLLLKRCHIFAFVSLLLMLNRYCSCIKKEYILKDLEAAIRLISRVKLEIPSEMTVPKAMDCADLYARGFNTSLITDIWPVSRLSVNRSIKVICDMEFDGGGWTVLNLKSASARLNDYFYKSWKEYKKGFGIEGEDYWIGNDNIFMLTNQTLYTARFDEFTLEPQRRTFADCDFWIDDESNEYALHVDKCTGRLRKEIMQYNNRKFSTFDHYNGNSLMNCAKLYKTGWWHSHCSRKPPNWKGWQKKSIPWTMLKIRPTNFLKLK